MRQHASGLQKLQNNNDWIVETLQPSITDDDEVDGATEMILIVITFIHQMHFNLGFCTKLDCQFAFVPESQNSFMSQSDLPFQCLNSIEFYKRKQIKRERQKSYLTFLIFT